MKPYIKYALLIVCLTALSCSKDPKVRIYDELEFDQCLTPVNVRFKVEFVEVTVSCEKEFPDAEKYELEVYSEPVPGEDEVNDEFLIRRDFIDELPYSFTGPDETPCYMRIRAINESAGKKPSRWTIGYVMTDVDPEHNCARPVDAKAVATFTSVKFSWTQASNVKQYEIEIYKEPLPTSGEPYAGNLYCPKIVKDVTEIPFTMEFPIRKFYFRVRGINEEDGLKPSSWVRGSFETKDYEWPAIQDAFDYGYSHTRPRTSTITADAFAHASVTTVEGTSEVNWVAGTKVPAETEYTVDGVTYGPDVQFESDGDRVTIAACNSWDKTSYARNFPLNRYLHFSVNKPGALSIPIRLTGTNAPKLYVGLKTTKVGVTQFMYIYEDKIDLESVVDSRITVNIDFSRADLMGIDEAAEIYIFGGLVKMSIYPITWTPAE